ncbi:Dolichyl-diphosphooligosaccharide--protein glycosyltransferase 48 kDa subunit [Aphelenchoides besseyi]|nr:Dolichyl-diphosphooligosaccharide--protein glycosyltransferase 48 kDa subunit [Aphelenchoides besseyi]
MRSLFLLFVITQLTVAAQNRILLLVDNSNIEKTHSLFLKSLRDRNYQLTVKSADDSTLTLSKFGEFLYDHVIIFAPKVEEFGGSISPEELGRFVDEGGNVLVAADSSIGEAIRDFATEVGFEFGSDGTAVIDHHNFDSRLDDGKHTTIVVPSSQLTIAELIVGKKSTIGPILYQGVALSFNDENPLRLTILNAGTTAYAFKPTSPIDEYPQAIGKSTTLIGALQARNNARVVLCGSLKFFSDEFINHQVQTATGTSKSGNGELATAISKWVLKETGVLRVSGVKHHKKGQTVPPREYTITDDVHYEIGIEELKDGKWIPFNGKDVQLEFVRIDPFVRTTLKNSNGKFTADFRIPDVYGVFKFLVDYHRIGYTHLFDVQQVSVRPFEHTQYERFVHSAYPYYVSSFSMMIGVLLFAFVFLYHKESTSTAPATSASTAQTKKSNKSRLEVCCRVMDEPLVSRQVLSD